MTLEEHFLELQKTLIETRGHLIKMSDHLVKTNVTVLRLQERIGVLERREPLGEKPFDFGALQALLGDGK